MLSRARKRDADKHPTLGIFRPKQIKRLVIKPTGATWTERQLAILRQGHLFEKHPVRELEKIPYNFQYELECDDAECSGHTIICTDWEVAELFRKCRDDYGAGWEAKFRQRYEYEMIQKKNTHFFMGTMRGHPGTWIIVGLFYPPLARTEPELQPMLNGLQ